MKWLLRVGLTLAALLMAMGLVVRLATGEVAAPAVSLGQVTSSMMPWSDRLMAVGALLLGLTPAFRVLALLVLWIAERDWRFVGVAALVVVALTVALFLGG